MFGFTGKILKIDLTSGQVSEEELSQKIARQYLGGLALASYYLYRDSKKGVDALDEQNPLLIAPGLLVPINVPTASKTTFLAKSPATSGTGRAVVGATLGVQLKKAGFDLLEITGKSKEPVIISIMDKNIKIEKTDLWGLDTRETQKKLKEKYGNVATAAIGPAGENVSKISGVDCEDRQAARTGIGAVLGSKKLKGLVVKGSGTIEVFNPQQFKELVQKWAKTLREHPAAKEDMNYGTGEFYSWMNTQRGTFPSRNWQNGYFQSVFDNLKENEKSHIDPYYWAPIYAKKFHPCPNCNKPCGHMFEIKEGKYKGVSVDGIEYETLYSLGGNLEIDDPEAVAYLNLLCDLYGLDTISAGVTLSWAMEAREKGILPDAPQFGDVDGSAKLLKEMAFREGFLGSLLADGVKPAVERLGKGNEFAMHIKGLEPPAYDIRGIKGMALAEAVSVRGACHLTAGVYGLELTGKWWKFEGVDRFSADNKGFEVMTMEDLMVLYDTVGMCKFSRHMFFLEGFLEIIYAATGFDMSSSELMLVGERAYNIQRSFNVREGLSRKDDSLPYRVTHDPIPKGVSKGALVKEEELQKMLDDYYQARGWSKDGVPTKVKLQIIDLSNLITDIGV
jgi:aldehyde:ferredoxin oxidoreductase